MDVSPFANAMEQMQGIRRILPLFLILALFAGVWSLGPERAYGDSSQTFSSAGTFTFNVPTGYTSLQVTVNGGGGGGGGGQGSDCSKGCSYVSGHDGVSGGNSSFNATVVGSGGSLGTLVGTAGSAGTASGGDTNTTGGGASGGAGGDGSACNGGITGGAGGAGGQAVKTYGAGAISGSITVVVGAGGTGGAGGVDTCTGGTGVTGTTGSVIVTWIGAVSGRVLRLKGGVRLRGGVRLL